MKQLINGTKKKDGYDLFLHLENNMITLKWEIGNMNFKLLIFINLLIIILPVTVWSQNDDLVIETQVDSFSVEKTEKDSLVQFKINTVDSLHITSVENDSLSVEAIIDTAGSVLETLKNQLDEYLEEKRQTHQKLFIPHLIYNENLHLKSPFDPVIQFTKNGFTIIPFEVSNTHILQNYKPFFNTRCVRDNISFTEDNYDLPVAFSESYLGLGDFDMNHVTATLKKGNILGIKNLHFEGDYIGQDGKWLGTREQSRNYNIHLFYDLNLGKIHFYQTTIDQEINTNKLKDAPELPEKHKIEEWGSDSAILFENRFISIGGLIQTTELDTMKRKLSEIMLTKSIRNDNNLLTLTWEYFRNTSADSTFNIFSLNQSSDIYRFHLGNSGYYQDEDNYFLSSELSMKIFKPISISVKHLTHQETGYSNLVPKNKAGAGLIVNPSFLRMEFIYGTETFDNSLGCESEDIRFFEMSNIIKFNIRSFGINLSKWMLYRDVINLHFPTWQSKTIVEIIYNMTHNNAIKLGLSHFYTSEYKFTCDATDTIYNMKNLNLDAYIAFQITDRFEIKLDAVNLTNSDHLFAYPSSSELPGFHINFNVKWIFVN